MMATKERKKGGVARGAVSVVASVALALAMCPAAAFGATYTAPTYAKDGTADDGTTTYVKCAAHAAAEPIAYLLGLDNTTYRTSSFSYDVNDYDSVASNTRLGVFGSSVNENADSFLWNMFYNAYATANDLETTDYVPKTISGGGPNGADSSGASIYWRPETICGISSSNMASSYEAQVAAVEENLDDDATNDYDPVLVAYDMSGLTTMIETTYALAAAADDVIAQSGGTKTSRYNDGDTTASAEDYESIILSTQYYVLAKIADGTTERKTYAYVSSIDSDTQKFAVSFDSPDTFETSSSVPGRLMAGIQNCTDNIANLLQESGVELEYTSTTSDRDGSTSYTYYLTAEQIMQADVIIYTGGGVSTGGGGNDSSTSTADSAIAEVLAAAGYTDSDAYPSVFTSASDPVGVLNSNGVENALYVPEVLGFIYNDIIDQMDFVGWYFKHLYHVTDTDLQTAVDGACEGMTAADDLTVAEGYEDRVEAAFEEGDAYYAANADAIDAEYPNLISYERYLDTLGQINNSTTSLASSVEVYTGDSIWPSVVCDGTTLTQTSAFTAKYYDADGNRVYAISEVGTYTVEVTGIDSYTGNATLLFAVVEDEDDVDSVTSVIEAAQAAIDETAAEAEEAIAAAEEALAEAQAALAEAEAALAEAEASAEADATEAAEALAAAQAALEEAEAALAEAEANASTDATTAAAALAAAQEALEAAEAALEEAEAAATAAEEAAAAAEAEATSAEEAAATLTSTLAEVQSELETTKSELEAAQSELSETQAALEAAQSATSTTADRAANTMTVKKANKTVKYKKVKKKAVTVKAITVKKAKGDVYYKKASGSKKLTVNATTGKITVKKGTKKGTYKIKVKVTAYGNDNYKSASKTVTVKIKVK